MLSTFFLPISINFDAWLFVFDRKCCLTILIRSLEHRKSPRRVIHLYCLPSSWRQFPVSILAAHFALFLCEDSFDAPPCSFVPKRGSKSSKTWWQASRAPLCLAMLLETGELFLCHQSSSHRFQLRPLWSLLVIIRGGDLWCVHYTLANPTPPTSLPSILILFSNHFLIKLHLLAYNHELLFMKFYYNFWSKK